MMNHQNEQTNIGGERDPLDPLRRRLSEAYDALWDTFVDPLEPLFDTDGTRWLQVAAGSANGASDSPLENEQQLRLARQQCRQLAVTNEFAINGHENRISYIVGSGYTYRVVPKKRHDVSEEMLTGAQDVLDEFIEHNLWQRRQQEIVRRLDRDGEVFLRFFSDFDGMTQIRFIEPDQIATLPSLAGDSSASFGIQTDPRDVETVLAYYVDGQTVEAGAIQHRKANVDLNVKRGLPLFFPVLKNLRRAEKILRNMSVVTEIQSAIALIRKHRGATQSSVSGFVQQGATASVANSVTGKTTHIKRYGPGTILDAPAGTEYEFPASGLDASSFVTVLQAELRAVAARLVMPEFMFTSDASNANYASTLVAEGPAMRMFGRLQAEQIAADREVMRRVLATAVRRRRLSDVALSDIAIQVEPPSLKVRDELEEVRAFRIELNSGVLSPQTWSQRRGLDYEQEQANLRAFQRQDDNNAVG